MIEPNENGAQLRRRDTAEMSVIFIHSSLDDAGLNAAQFRVYAHLARRANGTLAWPGIDSISSVCRMHKETVIEAIKVLEARNMIMADRRPGKTTVYYLTKPSTWRLNDLSEMGNGSDQSDLGNGAVGNGERHQSGKGNERLSIEGNPLRSSNSAPSRVGKAKAGVQSDPFTIRIGKIMGRKPETPWSEKEVTSLNKLRRLNLSEQSIVAVEVYYLANRKLEKNYCRRDLYTLLNNFNGEVDRAFLWIETNPKKAIAVRHRLLGISSDKMPEPVTKSEPEPVLNEEQRLEQLKKYRTQMVEAGLMSPAKLAELENKKT